MDTPANSRLPLDGITVLELGMVLAGPFAGSLLADLGATVIKIEPPGTGDAARQMGPRKNGVSLWWGVATRGKKCITLNLKDPVARALFERLVLTADVVVENYRPGVLDRLGLGWQRLHAVNPRLVMLSITGFGQTGPGAGRPGFGKIAEGMSGIVELTGSPEQNPLFVGYSLADTTAGLFGVFAINLALYRRDVQGAGGAHIDLALYEPLLRMMEAQFAMHRAAGRAPNRSGSNDPYGWGRAAARDPAFAFVQASDGEWIEVVVPDGALNDIRRLTGFDGAKGRGRAAIVVSGLGTSESIRRCCACAARGRRQGRAGAGRPDHREARLFSRARRRACGIRSGCGPFPRDRVLSQTLSQAGRRQGV